MFVSMIISIFTLGYHTPIFADTYEVYDGTYKYSVTDGKVTILEYNETLYEAGEFKIPSKIGGWPVTGIGSSAFYLPKVTSIIVPDGVTSIGRLAFSSCENLQYINIPANVETIGEGAFMACPNLTTIDIDEGNQNYYIENNCLIEKLTNTLVWGNQSSVIPYGVERIQAYAFAHCNNLQEISLPESVSDIGWNAFYCCVSLKQVNISSCLTSIGSSAFYNCESLASINIPKSVTNIGNHAFWSCTKLKSVYIDDMLSWLKINLGDEYSSPMCNGADMYAYDTIVTNLVIPTGVTQINANAFYGCKSITSVIISKDINSIGNYAFKNCSNLKTVYINSPNIASTNTGSLLSNATSIYINSDISAVGQYIKNNYKCVISNVRYELDQYTMYNNDHFTFDNSCDTSCACGKYTRKTTHKYNDILSSDENQHWYSCVNCNEKKESSEHDFDGVCDSICDACNYVREIVHNFDNVCDTTCNICGYTRAVRHNYQTTWSKDGSKHWHACSICGAKKDEASHTPGAAATETTAQTCTECGYVIQAALGHTHSYGSAWEKDISGHWHECSCGSRKDEGTHTYDSGKVTKEPTVDEEGLKTYTCTACGATKTEAITKLPPATTENQTTPEDTTAPDETTTTDSTTEPNDTSPEDTTDGDTTVSDVKKPETTYGGNGKKSGNNDNMMSTIIIAVCVIAVLVGGGAVVLKKKN